MQNEQNMYENFISKDYYPPWSEGDNALGSVCPSVCPSVTTLLAEPFYPHISNKEYYDQSNNLSDVVDRLLILF